MKICKTIVEARADLSALRDSALHKRWGLVPTMGYLHEGHLSLVQRARAENDFVAASIFVNPTQFAPDEDLGSYPRDLQRDLALLEQEGVDLAFAPEETALYPPDFQTSVIVSDVTQRLEGASRPTHFRGVTTIVAKLFNILQPDRAYFGQKDAQQVVVVKRMVEDLNFNIQIVVCPIVREVDGLAMSSRNARLRPAERAAAPVLYHALSAARDAIHGGVLDGDDLRELMAAEIAAEPLARLDYVSVAHPKTLQELDQVEKNALLSGAIFVGDVRLIDNILI